MWRTRLPDDQQQGTRRMRFGARSAPRSNDTTQRPDGPGRGKIGGRVAVGTSMPFLNGLQAT